MCGQVCGWLTLQMMQVAAEHRRTLAYSPEVLDFLVGKVWAPSLHQVAVNSQQCCMGSAAT